MELNIDDEWEQFLTVPDDECQEEVSEEVVASTISNEICPKATDIYISTKTNIAYLNTTIDLKGVFWKIPIIDYGTPIVGIVKKQMKFNSTSSDELQELNDNLRDITCLEQNVITSINNPSGRIKFKDIRKVSIGLCKKDIVSYRSKKKSAFYNCFVMILRLKSGDIFKEYHVKVFNTGKLEIPGIQSDESFLEILELVIETMKPHTCHTLHVLHEKTHTVLINSNFNCGFYINRETLFDTLKLKYNLECIYDPCSYPGIQCKFYYYEGLEQQTGVQQTSIDNGVVVSFMIFRTGSVLIVGKCDEYVLRNIYSFLKLILANEFGHVGVKIIDRNAIVKPKNTKMRRKIISV